MSQSEKEARIRKGIRDLEQIAKGRSLFKVEARRLAALQGELRKIEARRAKTDT